MKVAEGREPSGFTPPDGSRRSAISASYFGAVPKEKSVAAPQSLREEHSRPLLNDLKTWLDAEALLPKSVSGKAATYTLNQWAALNCYLEDGDLSIDNNTSQLAMRPLAIDRRNWMLDGSKPAGHRAAILKSPIASCKANPAAPLS